MFQFFFLLKLFSSVFIFSSAIYAAEDICLILGTNGRVAAFTAVRTVQTGVSSVSDTEEKARLQAHRIIFHAYSKQVSEVVATLPVLDIVIVYSKSNAKHIERVKKLYQELTLTGIPSDHVYVDVRPVGTRDVFRYADKVLTAKKVIVVGSSGFKKEYESSKGLVTTTITNLRLRLLGGDRKGIIPLWFEGRFEDAFPVGLYSLPTRDLGVDYHLSFFDLLMDLYQVDSFSHPIKSLKEEFGLMINISPSILKEHHDWLLRFQEERRAENTTRRAAILEEAAVGSVAVSYSGAVA